MALPMIQMAQKSTEQVEYNYGICHDSEYDNQAVVEHSTSAPADPSSGLEPPEITPYGKMMGVGRCSK